MLIKMSSWELLLLLSTLQCISTESIKVTYSCRGDACEKLVIRIQGVFRDVEELVLMKTSEADTSSSLCRYFVSNSENDMASVELCGRKLSGFLSYRNNIQSIQGMEGDYHLQPIRSLPKNDPEIVTQLRGYADGHIREVSFIETLVVDGLHSPKDLKSDKQAVLKSSMKLMNDMTAVYTKLGIQVMMSALRVKQDDFPVSNFTTKEGCTAYIDKYLNEINSTDRVHGRPDLILFLVPASIFKTTYQRIAEPICSKYPIVILGIEPKLSAKQQLDLTSAACKEVGIVLGLQKIELARSKECGCQESDGFCIMSSSKEDSLRWSSCSRSEILKLFQSTKLDCLQEQNIFLETSVYDPTDINHILRWIVGVSCGILILVLLTVLLIPWKKHPSRAIRR